MAVSRVKVRSRVIDWIAAQASKTLRTTGRMTAVVQSNGSGYTSHLTRQQWQRWRSLGLFLFFLPQYCSEMNRIEDEWHQLKTQEKALGVCSRMNMMSALAIMDGMKARSVKGGYTVERFKFNSA